MIKNAYDCGKKKIWNQEKTSKEVENDSDYTRGQSCKIAYVPFHERAVTFETSESLCANEK